ncbi:MAG: UMP kinase [Candidatus Staskawiczbacteria bacterium]|nr:UMP kinase [Candidatus Staskawiczbacteria bacterium]
MDNVKNPTSDPKGTPLRGARETIIISLGGSLVAPDEIDLGFLKNFRHSLSKYIGDSPSTPLRARQFFVLVGGGKIARAYQKALLEFGAKSNERDWIGIDVTKLNAEVVKQLFSGYSYPKIVTDPKKKIKTTKEIIVGAGYKPGWSTDYVSVLTAKNYGLKTIINLTNVDYVYDKNPLQFPDAKPLKDIDWKNFERIVGDKWIPGLSMPFDPKASKLAAQLKLKVIMINGKNLERLEDFLNNKPFIGTVIS